MQSTEQAAAEGMTFDQLREQNERIVKVAAELTAIREDKGEQEAERTALRRERELFPVEGTPRLAPVPEMSGHEAFASITEIAGAILSIGGPEEMARYEEYQQSEEARGELAGAPDEMVCHACSRQSGQPEERRVVALGPVVEAQRDPTQTYRLSCGHTEIG